MTRLTTETVQKGLRAAIEIKSGKAPTRAELDAAPVLTHWAISEDGFGLPRLAGSVSDHPLLGTCWCTTSVVLVLDPDHRWARTVSRLYALAEPLMPDVDPGRHL